MYDRKIQKQLLRLFVYFVSKILPRTERNLGKETVKQKFARLFNRRDLMWLFMELFSFQLRSASFKAYAVHWVSVSQYTLTKQLPVEYNKCTCTRRAASDISMHVYWLTALIGKQNMADVYNNIMMLFSKLKCIHIQNRTLL